jgi:lipopolysaccharide transport system permease protein
MVVFTVIFSRFARMPSDGLPYQLFAFAALLPWTYFSEAVNRSGVGLVLNANLISKVYFPRLIVPLAAALAPLVDFVLAFLVLVALMGWYGTTPTVLVLMLPLFLLLACATATGIGLWLSALNVKYRDVRYVIPFLIQIWMYASPVAYPMSLVPPAWRSVYALNPMVIVIEGFRWCLLGAPRPEPALAAMSTVVVAVLLLGGLLYFKKMERTFADLI